MIQRHLYWCAEAFEASAGVRGRSGGAPRPGGSAALETSRLHLAGGDALQSNMNKEWPWESPEESVRGEPGRVAPAASGRSTRYPRARHR